MKYLIVGAGLSGVVIAERIANVLNDKVVIIDDDKNIKLIGNLDGKVSGGGQNLKGWKNYIYGKYKIIEHIYNKYENKNEMVINCRFDVLENSNCISNKEIITFIFEKWRILWR